MAGFPLNFMGMAGKPGAAAAQAAAGYSAPSSLATLAGSAAGGIGKAGAAMMGMSNPLGWATLGVGLLTSMAGTGAERKAGRRKMGYIGEQQSMLEGAGQQVTELAGMKTELSQDIYGTDLSKSMFKTGQDLYGLTRQGGIASAATGFAKSEQVESQVRRGMESGIQSFGFQRQGLQDVLGEKLLNIAEWEGGEQSRLASEQSRLKYEMEEARAQSKKKFLGIF